MTRLNRFDSLIIFWNTFIIIKRCVLFFCDVSGFMWENSIGHSWHHCRWCCHWRCSRSSALLADVITHTHNLRFKLVCQAEIWRTHNVCVGIELRPNLFVWWLSLKHLELSFVPQTYTLLDYRLFFSTTLFFAFVSLETLFKVTKYWIIFFDTDSFWCCV